MQKITFWQLRVRLENVIGRPDVVANAVNESCLTTAAMVRVKTCRHDRSILHSPMITVLFGSPLHCQMSRSLLSAHLNAASLILVDVSFPNFLTMIGQ